MIFVTEEIKARLSQQQIIEFILFKSDAEEKRFKIISGSARAENGWLKCYKNERDMTEL